MVGGRELRSAGEGVGTEDRAHGSDSRRGQMSGAAVSIQDCVSCDLHNVALRMSIFVVFDFSAQSGVEFELDLHGFVIAATS
mmetsp:Transcript_74997/g.190266  ORF Transcript_74997/g.190266 Transcript_74997/m.190266 type:complete len:82 (-) Transcript_74997:7-252(-)